MEEKFNPYQYVHIKLERSKKFNEVHSKYFDEYWKHINLDEIKEPNEEIIKKRLRDYSYLVSKNLSLSILRDGLWSHVTDIVYKKERTIILSDIFLPTLKTNDFEEPIIRIEGNLTHKKLILILDELVNLFNEHFTQNAVRDVFDLSSFLIESTNPTKLEERNDYLENKGRTFDIKILKKMKEIETNVKPKPKQFSCLIDANRQLKIHNEEALMDINTEKPTEFGQGYVNSYKAQKKKL